MAEGYNIGNNPYNIWITSINSLFGHTEFNLQNEYTFIDPPPSPIVVNNGKVQIIAFAQYNDANSQNFLKSLQQINTAYSGDTNPNFKIVGVLYNNGGSINPTVFDNTVNNVLRTDIDPAKQASYDFLNNPSWIGSPAENYLINYGVSVTSPVVYIISKYYLIAYKTHLGLHADVAAMIAAINTAVASLLAGPTISSVSPIDGTLLNALNTVAITFSEKIKKSDGSAIDATCFRLSGAVGTLYNPYPNSISPDVTELIYTLTTGDVTHTPGNGALSLDISRIVAGELHITDRVFYSPVPLVGNGGHDYYTVNYTADTLAPTISIGAPSVSNANSSANVTYTVTYTGADSVTLSAADITLNKTGTADGTVSVSGSGNTTRTVTISNPTGNGTLSISIAANSASDNAGNQASAAGPSATFTVDNIAPSISIGSPSVSIANALTSVTYTITYTGADTATLAPGDITLNATGTANGTIAISGSGTGTRTVTVGALTGNGTLGISIAAGTASDNAGNTAPAAGPSVTFTVDATAPSVTLGSPTSGTATGVFTVTIHFSESVTGFVIGDVTVSAGAKSNFTGSGQDYTVDITPPASSTGTINVDVAAGVAQDAAGNPNTAATTYSRAYNTVSLSSAKDITSFIINALPGTIGANTVTLVLPEGTDVTSLSPTITVSPGATVNPASGAAQDFTSPVSYTVTAEDSSTKTYTVTVTAAYVYIRDSLSDDGTEAAVTGACTSPDIIIWPDSTANASTFPDNGTAYGSNVIEIGQPNYIYLRVLNKSNVASEAMLAKLCYGPLITLLYPGSPTPITWTEIATDINIPAVPAASGGVPGYAVSSVITWLPSPAAVSTGFDAYCLIAMFRKTADTYPDGYTSITDWNTYLQFIHSHKNLAYKNITTQDIILPNLLPMPLPKFHVQGFKKGFNWDLELDARKLPKGSVVSINVHNNILGKKPELVNMKEIREKKKSSLRWFQVNENKAGIVKNLSIPEKKIYQCALSLKLPPDARHGEKYNLRISQRVGKNILGSVNYIIRGIAFEKAKFIGVLSTHLVHKKDCKYISRIQRDNMVPFENLAEARKKGFDPALDCLNIPFKPGDISGRLQFKILQYINAVKGYKELQKRISDTLGIGYFKDRYGIADKMGRGLSEAAAKEIINKRDKLRGFKRLEQVDKISGVGKDTFIDLVNSFKESDTSVKPPRPVKIKKPAAPTEPKKQIKLKKPAKSQKQAKAEKTAKPAAKPKKQAKLQKPSKLNKPVKPAKAQKQVKPKTAVKLKKLVKPAKMKKQTKPKKAAKLMQPAKAAKPKKQSKPQKPAKLNKAVKPKKQLKKTKVKKQVKAKKQAKPVKKK